LFDLWTSALLQPQSASGMLNYYAILVIALMSQPILGAVPAHAPPSQIQFIGRVPSPPLPQLFTWAYTSIKFGFEGTEANFTFTSTGQNALAVSVDGSDITTTPKTVFDATVNPNGTLSTGKLARGFHTVEMFRVSETDHGTITFSGVHTDGQLIAIPHAERKIEFIGDSITVGYGADGELPCLDSATTENAAKTYAAIIGKNVSADISLIAWSGRGVIRNYPDANGQSIGPTMPTLWTQTTALDTTPTYKFPTGFAAPQAVVINLGTNDFAYLTGPNGTASRPALTQGEYQTAMLNFITRVQGKYPHAKIFLVSSPMLSGDQHATQLAGLQEVGSMLKNVFVTDLPPQSAPYGCDYHPTPATHQQMASILLPVVKSKLGW
jgi:lysophospholipase L1-like esterase